MGQAIYNMSKGHTERVANLMIAFADDFKNVSEVTQGNIAVIAGLKMTSTGDTLVESSSLAKSVTGEWEKKGLEIDAVSPVLPGVPVPGKLCLLLGAY